uniref:Zgc:194930 n=1 Tax=Amphilophus citrinellus TaxID=61819 RepID=A0A3Q0SFS3_AMPCI
MGCRCCRMIKYVYDPSAPVDVRKTDSRGGSLYQAQHRAGRALNSHPSGNQNKQKQGFHNLAYSRSNESTLKLEVDNNHVNQRLHRQGSIPPTDGGLYIIQPQGVGQQWMMQEKGPSQVPVYPSIENYEKQGSSAEQRHQASNGWNSSVAEHEIATKELSADEIDEGVGGTPEYLCDTGDEGSVLSVDIQTSTTSLSSGGTKDELALPKTPDVSTVESGISVSKSEDEEQEVQSITDSMVAEALAALEAATAGEDYE